MNYSEQVDSAIRGWSSQAAEKFRRLVVTEDQSIANLDRVREIVLADPDRLNMSIWHRRSGWINKSCEQEAACGTSHCIAGWLQVCSDDPEIRSLDPNLAGIICAPQAASAFYVEDAEALEWFKNRSYAKE